MPRDLDELLAAYALNALDEDERRAVDALLDRSSDARAQLREHQETIARLHGVDTPAPPQIWPGIKGRIDAQTEASDADG